MNRHQRRAAARKTGVKARPLLDTTPTLGDPLEHHIVYPDDVKEDIAKVVRAVEWINAAGGTCFFRMASSNVLLRYLGIPAVMALGGMVARIGPDPQRDVVAFCGEGNVGRKYSAGMLAHYWLLVGNDLVDFSVGDWRVQFVPELEFTRAGVALEPPQWTTELPRFHWAARDTFAPTGGHTPELGQAWYTGFAGEAPPWNTMLKDIAPQLKQVMSHVRPVTEDLALKERVWAAQNGHTAIRLSELATIASSGNVVVFPQTLEKLMVLRGKPEITRELAAELLTEAGIRFG